MFSDQAKVTFKAGKGGDGMVHFRREKYIDRGGPDGGDGGKGGSIIVRVDENVNTLADFNTKKIFQAEDGSHGDTSNKHGKDGEDLLLSLPLGTQFYNDETNELIIDLATPKASAVIVRGGKGGFGNAHFASSVRQTPRFAELGEEGEVIEFRLELKLVADIGIIGLPSVGKSTLISRLSHARPKIADYPFTTIIPNLGIVDLGEFDTKERGKTFVIADMPGLIEGAHEGKGLGHAFLRHISRTRLLVHLLDASSSDIVRDFEIVDRELRLYDPKLAKEEQIVVFNKIDLIDDDFLQLFQSEFLKKYPRFKGKILAISAITGKGMSELVFTMWKRLNARKRLAAKDKPVVSEEEYKVFRPHIDDDQYFEIRFLRFRRGGKARIFEVKGKRIEQVVKMTDFSNDEAVARVYDIFYKMGLTKELLKQGAAEGDTLRIAGREISFMT
ncbi:GTPase ObgE [Candidatus Peregrinibacteria bacterium]|nr:GTPase ObgE [Candidatus Peregrinibacteria bacterium]